MRLDVVAHRRAGSDAGDNYLRRCELDVARTARGVTERWTLTLPTPSSLLVDPVAGRAWLAMSRWRGPLRLVG
ncbi:hypothetical protein JN535_18875 [Cellulosimicrobium cellulans]|uniref:hypothetical protein n=1 Tax=Cellulosimicrobium cellulans TaxID=1710 RepID=UPI0019668A52|nr:hypothetical protein [Cellulosimicrobium cellulans]MBN0042221.1 hypothetical protein [Cellulosimicrobium cellulans]